MNLTTIVGHVGGRCKGQYEEQNDWREAPARSTEVKSKIKQHVDGLFDFIEKENEKRRFDEVERGLKGLIFALARLFLAYYLARRHEGSEKEVGRWKQKGYRRRKPQRKHLNTFFGRVTFWRTYVRRPGGSGLHPLDLALGITTDGFSLLATEIGGTEPNGLRSLVHLLVYADVLDIEGLVPSGYGPSRKRHIFDIIDTYARAYASLRTYCDKCPRPITI